MRSGAMAELDEAERSRISAEYNLQIGLIFASLAFGASEQIRRVSLRMDSLGLEEAVYERDNAIKTLMDLSLIHIYPGEAVLAPKPGYPLIESIARLCGVKTVERCV